MSSTPQSDEETECRLVSELVRRPHDPSEVEDLEEAAFSAEAPRLVFGAWRRLHAESELDNALNRAVAMRTEREARFLRAMEGI